MRKFSDFLHGAPRNFELVDDGVDVRELSGDRLALATESRWSAGMGNGNEILAGFSAEEDHRGAARDALMHLEVPDVGFLASKESAEIIVSAGADKDQTGAGAGRTESQAETPGPYSISAVILPLTSVNVTVSALVSLISSKVIERP